MEVSLVLALEEFRIYALINTGPKQSGYYGELCECLIV